MLFIHVRILIPPQRTVLVLLARAVDRAPSAPLSLTGRAPQDYAIPEPANRMQRFRVVSHMTGYVTLLAALIVL